MSRNNFTSPTTVFATTIKGEMEIKKKREKEKKEKSKKRWGANETRISTQLKSTTNKSNLTDEK